MRLWLEREFRDCGQFLAQQQMSCILPLALASQSEPYELVTRTEAPVPPARNC